MLLGVVEDAHQDVAADEVLGRFALGDAGLDGLAAAQLQLQLQQLILLGQGLQSLAGEGEIKLTERK